MHLHYDVITGNRLQTGYGYMGTGYGKNRFNNLTFGDRSNLE